MPERPTRGAASPEARAALETNGHSTKPVSARHAEQDMGRYRVRRFKIVIPFVQGGLADETRAWGENMRAEFVDVTGDEEATSS